MLKPTPCTLLHPLLLVGLLAPAALVAQPQPSTLAQTVTDRKAEADRLLDQGIQQYRTSQYRAAIQSWEQALSLYRQLQDHRGEGAALGNLGNSYHSLGQYAKAIDLYRQHLTIAREIEDRQGEANALGGLGSSYFSLGQYAKAIDLYQQWLTIAREISDHNGEASALGGLGISYGSLGQYAQAIEFLQQGLTIAREIGDSNGEASALGNLGVCYRSLGQYAQAIEFHQQALTIARKIGDRNGEGTALGNLGNSYFSLGQYAKAIDLYQQHLTIARQIGDRNGEGRALGNLGSSYRALGQYSKAIEFTQQLLTIAREIDNREGLRLGFNNLAVALEKQQQPELAVLFYKQSVNATETIRQGLRGLSPELQQSYSDRVSFTYRTLADLLLQQNRVLEAQRVLDLLKVQELDDYLRGVRGNAATQRGIELIPLEQPSAARVEQILQQSVTLGKELTALRQISLAARTPAQTQRIGELVQAEQVVLRQFNQFLTSPEVKTLVASLSQTSRQQTLNLESLPGLPDNLAKLGDAVLIYPLILPDRLELVLVTAYGPPLRRTVPVKQADLNRAIVEFRQAIQDRSRDPKPAAQKLYDLLIRPLEADLAAAGAKTLVYAPDGQLRYVPLAALYDGKQWLVERFRINNITAASLTDFNTPPHPHLTALAAAFTQGQFQFTLGKETFRMAGLPFAAQEVTNLTRAIPSTTSLLNQDFSRQRTVPMMDDHTIVHLATHAAFVIGAPEESFILFGNGDRVSLADIKNGAFGTLKRVDLIVLSACETGLGGIQNGTGAEILGFGYLMQNIGARAALASLWAVNDGGTQVLMDAFYQALKQPNITKAEALRRAQMALIASNQPGSAVQRTIGIELDPSTFPATVASHLSHPYYWAPFILIGNGL